MFYRRTSLSNVCELSMAVALVFNLLAQPSRRSTVPVQDPTLGIVQGDLPVLPGWHGEAHIDRTTDPLSYAIGTLTADLRSPDGTTTIQMLAVHSIHLASVSNWEPRCLATLHDNATRR